MGREVEGLEGTGGVEKAGWGQHRKLSTLTSVDDVASFKNSQTNSKLLFRSIKNR